MPKHIKKPRDLKSHHVSFRLLKSDYDKLEAQAVKIGLSVNQLARRLSCSRIDKVVIQTQGRLDPIYLKRLEEIIRQLSRVGNNLNQSVMAGHIHGQPMPKAEFTVDNLNALAIDIEQVIFHEIEQEASQ